MTRATQRGTLGATPPPEEGQGADAPDSPEAAALATRTTPTGVAGAVEWLRAHMDEGAHLAWKTGGPRNSVVSEVGCALVEVQDGRRYFIAIGYNSGGWKLFAEVPGKKPSEEGILAMYGLEPDAALEPTAQEIGGAQD